MHLLFCILLVLFQTLSQCAVPIAQHLKIRIQPEEQVVITLAGYDTDGDSLVATIVSLPESGILYQVSQVFDTHGYDPKAGKVIAKNDVVTGKGNKIVYARPEMDTFPDTGKYAEFMYTVHDGSDGSNKGLVEITYDTTSMKSEFYTDQEGWSVEGNGENTLPVFQEYSMGMLQYFIMGSDNLIKLSMEGDDERLWYFNAPSKFLGNHWDIYGGKLHFVLMGLVGDFQASNLNANGMGDFIVLECSACHFGNGIRLVRRLDNELSYDGEQKTFNIELSETSGWLKDSKSTIEDFTTPTQCEFVSVVSGLTKMQIYGDFTKQRESVALDDVRYIQGEKKQPIACYE